MLFDEIQGPGSLRGLTAQVSVEGSCRLPKPIQSIISFPVPYFEGDVTFQFHPVGEQESQKQLT